MSVLKLWLIGEWYPCRLIVLHQRYRPSLSYNSYIVDLILIGPIYILNIYFLLDVSYPSMNYLWFFTTGLMTSLCLPAFVTSGFHGVACTDVKLSELLKEVEFFEEGNSSYAFMIDKTGRALVHPLLPDATYVKLEDDPVQVDITTLERSPNSGEVIDKIKRYSTRNI